MRSVFSRIISPQVSMARTYSCQSNKKLVVYEFGDPKSVLKMEENEVDTPKGDEVLVEMLVASINPADINTIQGTYPIKPKLPGVPGHEGVGKVVEVGPNASGVQLGDLVIPNTENFGSWEKYKLVQSDQLLKVPSLVPLVEVCGISSNTSTAYRMLKDFVALQPGDAVIQNGANSAAGQNVIQLCKSWGVKSVNIVRNRPDIDQLKEHLKCLGADVVLTEEELRATKMFKNGEMTPPKLALNCVGGKNAMEVLRHLSQKGVMVTYGGMSREPVMIPTSLLIFKDVAIKGFWMTRWTRENRNSETRKAMLDELYNLMIDGKLKAPAHKLIPMDQYTDALESLTNPKGFAGTKFLIDFRL
uniref:Enoyl-[acyl-carrier-protein] reductase, mitochondrial n=1 Tax=Lygus hesperus TaxID=30085 RepID=A0A0A9WK09_LYGHE